MIEGIFTLKVAEGPTCGGCQYIGTQHIPGLSKTIFVCKLLTREVCRERRSDGTPALSGPPMKCDECLSAVADFPVFSVWSSGAEAPAVEKHCGNCWFNEEGCFRQCIRDGSSDSMDNWEELK